MLRGEYAIYFSYKVVWGGVHGPAEDIINFSLNLFENLSEKKACPTIA